MDNSIAFRRRRPDAAIFVVSSELIAAIDVSPRTLGELARAVGMCQSHLSSLLHGARFGRRVRSRVEAIGASLDVPAERCAREVSRD